MKSFAKWAPQGASNPGAHVALVFALAGSLSLARGQAVSSNAVAAPVTEEAPSSAEQTIAKIKNPFSWLSWGSDFRLRNEYFNNALTLNPNNPLHEQDYFRLRARLWASVAPVDDLSLNTRLAVEAREWLKAAGYTPDKFHEGPDYSEGVVDTLNVQWKNPLKLPANIIVGRQDIILGDGWLVEDGTPLDGSWTYYLDSARLTYKLEQQSTLIDVIGIVQDARDNGWLSPISAEDQKRFVTEQNEKGAILNVANSSLPAANLTGYFIYKHDDRANFHDYPVLIRPRGGDNANIYTLGGRVNGVVDGGHIKYWAEGAYQFGQKQDADISDAATAADPAVRNEFRDLNAFGVNSKLSYLLQDKLNDQFTLSYEFLTGDDPRTKDDEMFDVLWGRWPHSSEISFYTYGQETRVGQAANVHRIGPTWNITPLKDLDFSASYWALFAQQDVPTRGVAGLFTDTGNFRGHLCQAVLKYKFSQRLSAHLWSEFQFPGDYYVYRQVMDFFRFEVMFTF